MPETQTAQPPGERYRYGPMRYHFFFMQDPQDHVCYFKSWKCKTRSIVIYKNVYFVGSQWNFGEEIMIIKKACIFEFQISPTAATVNTSNIPNNSQGQTIFSQFSINRKYC